MGKVIAICISEEKGTQKHSVQEAEFIEDWGIKGDAHAGKWHRQVSLLSFDKIEDFRARGAEVTDGAFGENIVVEGFDSGYDLANLTSDLYLRAKKLFGFFYCLTGNNLANLELQLLKILKCDLCFWLKINSRLLFLFFLYRRMELFYLCHYLFKIKTGKQNFRFFYNLIAGRIQAKSIQ